MEKKSLDVQIIVCGRGGQGVLFITRLLDEVALSLGYNVISSETHGMAMRGGSVASHIRIGNYASPLIRSGGGDIMLALAENELPLNVHLLKQHNASIYVNSRLKKQRAIHADCIAEKLGSIVVANLVLLGFACAHEEFPFTYKTVKNVLQKISPRKVLNRNLDALAEGHRAYNNALHDEY